MDLATLRHCTRDGILLDFSKQLPEDYTLDMCLETIGREKRFSNQSDLSVLEHSYAMGQFFKKDFDPGFVLNISEIYKLVCYAYTHDIQEAILRDIPSPIKKIIGEPMEDLENLLQCILFDHFKLPVRKMHLADVNLASLFNSVDSYFSQVELDNFVGQMRYPEARTGQGYESARTQMYEAKDTPIEKIIADIKDYIFS